MRNIAFSTRFVAVLQINYIARFCCPFYRTFNPSLNVRVFETRKWPYNVSALWLLFHSKKPFRKTVSEFRWQCEGEQLTRKKARFFFSFSTRTIAPYRLERRALLTERLEQATFQVSTMFSLFKPFISENVLEADVLVVYVR